MEMILTSNPSNLRAKDDWWKKEEATVEAYRAMDTLDRINLEWPYDGNDHAIYPFDLRPKMIGGRKRRQWSKHIALGSIVFLEFGCLIRLI